MESHSVKFGHQEDHGKIGRAEAGSSMDISEKNFEQTIEAVLLSGTPGEAAGGAGYASLPGAWFEGAPGGYRKHRPEDYDRALCLIPTDVFDFIYATQPKEWERFKKQHGAEAKERLLKR